MFNSFRKNILFNLPQDKPIYFIGILILSISSTCLSILGIVLLLPILSLFRQDIVSSSIDLPGWIGYILSLSSKFSEDDRLIIFLGSLALIAIAKSAIDYLNQLVGINHSKYLIYTIKSRSFNLLSKQSLTYFEQHQGEELLIKINREVEKAVLAHKNNQNILVSFFSIIILISVLFYFSFPLTLISLTILIGIFYLNRIIINLSIRNNAIVEKTREYNFKVIEFLTGIYHIQSIGNLEQEYHKITRAIKAKNQVDLNAQAIAILAKTTKEIVGIMAILILILSGYYLYRDRIQSLYGFVLLYILIFYRLLSIINQLEKEIVQSTKYIPSLEVVKKFLDEVNKPSIRAGKVIFEKLKTGIELQNIRFVYPNCKRPVLENINIKIYPQQTVAFIGHPDSGKSTLIRLIARLYDPTEGKILFNNLNIKEYQVPSLRQAISIISDDIFIFQNSIAYNITYGLQNISNAEIIAAAKITKAYNFISQLPEGLNTTISDRPYTSERSLELATKTRREISLTVEQKYLLAITRAILAEPEIVILDRPTDSLKQSSTQLIQQALDKLCRDRTTIIITNRLATIKQADQIIVLNKGKIVESGTHQTLLRNGNLYKRLYSAQFKTSQQSHQQQLAKRISQKLARHNNSNLSYEIRNNLNTLLNYLQLVNEGLIEDDLEQERILDESYQSAKNMLASLREYERKISRGFRKNNK